MVNICLIISYIFSKGRSEQGYDFAIFVLKEDVTLNDNVMVVNLPKEDANCSLGKELIVSGWGIDEYQGVGKHRYLWAVKQQCIDVSECTRYTGDPKAVLCVSDPEQPANSACHADSGGNNKFVIIENMYDQ